MDSADALRLVMSDVAATIPNSPISPRAVSSEPLGSVWAYEDRDGSAFSLLSGSSSGESVADLASLVQDMIIDRGVVGDVWPICPRHERHPLKPVGTADTASWVCPSDDTVIAPVGKLT